MIARALGVCLSVMGAALSSKSRSGPRLVLQPAGRRTARHTTPSALKRFFAIADAWELSPLQQCRLLKIPSPQVLARYRLGQAPRLSAVQQERAALIANIHRSLTRLPCTTRIAPGPGCMRRGKRRLSTEIVRFTSCSRTACRRCAKWRGCWCAKASPADPSRLRYNMRLFRCECGGIGRRARLRTWWGNPCEFESRLSHHPRVGKMNGLEDRHADFR